MIEGLKLKVTSEELKQHCTSRAAYHNRRATEKEAELPKLKQAMEAVKSSPQGLTSVSHMNKSGYHMDADAPVRQLEADIKEHKHKFLVFSFFADHLFEEDYTLMENDLQRLEILR